MAKSSAKDRLKSNPARQGRRGRGKKSVDRTPELASALIAVKPRSNRSAFLEIQKH
jgi:hypothetical protein